jgi:RHS repeat-associated protein
VQRLQAGLGVAQSTLTDARGRTTELDQYTTWPTITTPANTFTGLWTVTGGASQATLTKYNHRGQQSDTIDHAGNDWGTSYNLLGQITGKQDPDAGASTMTYDPAGNVTSTTDANGHTISYVYDDLNRKRAEYNAPPSSQAPANELASWTYDGPASSFEVGRLVSATAYVGGTSGTAYTETSTGYNVFGESLGQTYTIPATTTTSTDAAGQTTAVTTAGTASLAGRYTFSHQYTPTTGLPGRDSYPAGGGLLAENVGFSYGSALDLPEGAGQYASSTSYDAYRRVTREQINYGPNFAYITNSYDTHTGKLTDTAVTRTTAPVAVDDTSYTYNPAGNITSQTDTRQASTTETQCYSYDGLDRLTQAWTATDKCAAPPTTTGTAPNVGDGITGGTYWTSWTYNALGQRTNETDHSVTGGADTSTTYSYNGNGNGTNQPTTLTGTATTGPNGSSSASYGYDKTGNTTSRTLPTGPHTLTWTTTDKLATDTAGSTASSYVYDADGNVLLRQDGASTTLFLPGEQLVLNASTKSVSGSRFITLPGGGQAVESASSYSFEIPTDQHGTSTLTLDATAQNPTWRQFTPYGAPRGSTPATWPDQNGFLNAPTDSTDGLTTIGARQYDPTLGQFASLDPQVNPSDPQSLNGYSYSGDNPVTTADPTGLCPVDRCGYGVVNNGRQSDYGPIEPGDADAGYVSAHAPGAGTYAVGDRAGARRAEVEYDLAVARAIAARKAQEQQLRAQIAAAKRQQQQLAARAEQENVISPALSNGAAFFADVGAALATPVPGLDVAVDAGAGYLDEQAVGEDTAALTASGQDVGAALETSINEVEATLQADQQAVTEEEQALKTEDPAGCTANSFVGTTPVLMADGTTKPIEQVQVGDVIENAQPGAMVGTSDETPSVNLMPPKAAGGSAAGCECEWSRRSGRLG